MVAVQGEIQVRRDTSTNWLASNPVLGLGEIGFDSTVNRSKVGDGSTAWKSLGWATDTPFTPPPSTGWSTTTLGSTTITDNNTDRLMTIPSAAGDNHRVEYRTLSPASNYTLTVYINAVPGVLNTTVFLAGLYLRNSVSGSLVKFGVDFRAAATSLYIQKWTNPTTFSADYASISTSLVGYMPQWLRIVDDGTNRILKISSDGLDWYTLHTVGRTDFITPDQIGWGSSNSTGATGYVRLHHFSGVA